MIFLWRFIFTYHSHRSFSFLNFINFPFFFARAAHIFYMFVSKVKKKNISLYYASHTFFFIVFYDSPHHIVEPEKARRIVFLWSFLFWSRLFENEFARNGLGWKVFVFFLDLNGTFSLIRLNSRLTINALYMHFVRIQFALSMEKLYYMSLVVYGDGQARMKELK